MTANLLHNRADFVPPAGGGEVGARGKQRGKSPMEIRQLDDGGQKSGRDDAH